MVSYDDDEVEYFANYIKLAARMAGYIKSKQGECLYTVKIKGTGNGFYYSLSDKEFVWINKGSDLYWVDHIPKDEKGRYCLFAPHTFGIGVILLVPEEEIEWIGLN